MLECRMLNVMKTEIGRKIVSGLHQNLASQTNKEFSVNVIVSYGF